MKNVYIYNDFYKTILNINIIILYITFTYIKILVYIKSSWSIYIDLKRFLDLKI